MLVRFCLHFADLVAFCRWRRRRSGGGFEVLKVTSERDIETAFAAIADQRLGALFVNIDSFFGARADQLVALAARHRVSALHTDMLRVANFCNARRQH